VTPLKRLLLCIFASLTVFLRSGLRRLSPGSVPRELLLRLLKILGQLNHQAADIPLALVEAIESPGPLL